MLNTAAIQEAIDELEAQRHQLEGAISTLKGLLANVSPAPKNGGGKTLKTKEKRVSRAKPGSAVLKYKKHCDEHGEYMAPGGRSACPKCKAEDDDDEQLGPVVAPRRGVGGRA